jgi:hypothetical protein
MAPFDTATVRYNALNNVYSFLTDTIRALDSNGRVWSGPFSTSVNFIAMVVSDAGLASADPEWWNSSILGCILIGLQPRGCWQVMQRTVQWGEDSLANVFGVNCAKPALYAYFACSIRNRLEVWDSTAWTSPTEGSQEGAQWRSVGNSHLKRPTKLLDGSRGGPGFICNLLCPREDGTFSIVEQARMQFLSVILVAAGLMAPENLLYLKQVMRDDFEISDRVGVVFFPLLIGVAFGQFLSLTFSLVSLYAVFRRNLFHHSAPYVIQLCSVLSWAVGSICLLMLGGNPRVKIVDTAIPPYIEVLIKAAQIDTATAKSGNGRNDNTENEKAIKGDVEAPWQNNIRLEFGSIHGSVYIPSRGHCNLPVDVVRTICRWDLELQRPLRWKLGFVWSCLFLLISILLQIAGAQIATIGSESMAVALLMVTALARGRGVSGPEEWLIPQWRMRRGANYGAVLVGRMVSR